MAPASEAIVTAAPRRRHVSRWLGLALLLVAASMRVPIGSVGPVLNEVQRGVGLGSGAAGALTTLPILCFGLAGPLAPLLARRWRGEAIVLAAVAVIALGSLVRGAPQVLPLFGGTLLIGVAIAVANVLLPSVIRRDYERPGTMMGLYTMVLTGAPALAAGLTVPLEHALGSWELALAAGSIPALAAFAAWIPAVLRARGDAAVERVPVPTGLWRHGTAWFVTGFMGMQSLLFYVLLSWVPTILRDSGLTPGRAGLMLSICLISGLPGSLLAPMAASRMANQWPLVLFSVVLWIVGFVGLMLAPAGGAVAWMVLLGLAQGTAFGLSLMLILLRAPDAGHVAALSGMVQSFGYVLAAVGPFAVGLLHQLTGAWTAPIALLLVATFGELVVGLAASRPVMVGHPAAARPRVSTDVFPPA